MNKLSLLIPVFKTGDTTNISNYRPIALVSSVSEVFEMLGKNFSIF